MKDASSMSRAELLEELRLQHASADVAWAIAESLVEKVAELEKQLRLCSSNETQDLKRRPRR